MSAPMLSPAAGLAYIAAMPDFDPRPRPVVLCILDGWGERGAGAGADNAISAADTPNWDRMIRDCPAASLRASAGDVGLPDGQMGNSEVGHMTIGAGRVVVQDLPRIDAAIAAGGFAEIPALRALIDRLRSSGGACHLMGLVSPGGVHSHQDHLSELANILAAAGLGVRIHAFLDGRDTPPASARDFVNKFLTDLSQSEDMGIATIAGRYYAMDRDSRWDRVEKAYGAIVRGQGDAAGDARSAIEASYAQGITDEFMVPAVIGNYQGIKDGDGILMANFRADRARQLLSALVDPEFGGFEANPPQLAAKLGMCEYSAALNSHMAAMFPAARLSGILGEIVSAAGMAQLRIAETEKYAHVTFFLNGGREAEYAGEERIMVPSPRVATYDLAPEMSAPEVTDKLIQAIDGGRFDLIVVNYANGDMVGHTGDFAAAVKAVAAVDTCLGRLEAAVSAAGGTMLITADHGNVEQMKDARTGEAHTAHTLNPVPVILVNPPAGIAALDPGGLADIAPTLLGLLGLEAPAEMTGRTLCASAANHQKAGSHAAV